jgi:hypothetical protein
LRELKLQCSLPYYSLALELGKPSSLLIPFPVVEKKKRLSVITNQ